MSQSKTHHPHYPHQNFQSSTHPTKAQIRSSTQASTTPTHLPTTTLLNQIFLLICDFHTITYPHIAGIYSYFTIHHRVSLYTTQLYTITVLFTPAKTLYLQSYFHILQYV
ncbi:hypothetical protein HanIR_Chr16g0837531 [Helianthus annuus]|nr:hypothetical protein HanIR_Chr16g0837531 [Helianthus annuus]